LPVQSRAASCQTDSLAVSFVECVGNLDGITQHLIQRQRTFLQPLSQRLAFQILHHQEISSVLMADVVKRADVRMIQASNRPCFALEPFSQLGSIGKVIRKDFDGDDAIEPRIAGAVHLAHPTCTNGREDFIGPEALAIQNRHGSPAELVAMIPC
jgi:hypothetical protein